MSGHWPPGGEDPTDDEFIEQADQPGAEADARLSAVSAFLAAEPAPVMPDTVAARISAALAAESAARTAGATQAAEGPPADRPVLPRALDRPRRRARVRRFRGAARQILVRGSTVAVVCLVLAGFGFLLSRTGSSDSSSAESSGSSAQHALNSAAAGSSAAEPGSARQPLGGVSGEPAAFTVTDSGTRYDRATLARQVEARLRAPASSAAAGHAPSSGLRGCVLHVTGGSTPALVDQGSYQGTGAYVIASASHVWVVGLACTAAKPELVVSAPLAG
jgi:hypothetical protein